LTSNVISNVQQQQQQQQQPPGVSLQPDQQQQPRSCSACFITSRILVVDLLSHRIRPKQIAGGTATGGLNQLTLCCSCSSSCHSLGRHGGQSSLCNHSTLACGGAPWM
jgi:hypothetical protein